MQTENDKAIAKILDYAKCGLYHNYPSEEYHKEKHDYYDEAVKVFKSQISDLAQAKKEIEKLKEALEKVVANSGKTHDSYLEVVEMYTYLKLKATDLENDMKKISDASTNVECWVIANNSLNKYKK